MCKKKIKLQLITPPLPPPLSLSLKNKTQLLETFLLSAPAVPGQRTGSGIARNAAKASTEPTQPFLGAGGLC